jgi:hypothetical protein
MHRKVMAVVPLMLSFTASAVTEENCTWATQTDGSKWGTCVDDNGHMYCQSCPANGTSPCARVPCK